MQILAQKVPIHIQMIILVVQIIIEIMQDNLMGINNSSAKSNDGSLSQLVQSLRQIIDR
jgi:hypothetical protein